METCCTAVKVVLQVVHVRVYSSCCHAIVNSYGVRQTCGRRAYSCIASALHCMQLALCAPSDLAPTYRTRGVTEHTPSHHHAPPRHTDRPHALYLHAACPPRQQRHPTPTGQDQPFEVHRHERRPGKGAGLPPANTMWRKLLYSGFHTPKAVTYHEPTVVWSVHDRSQPWACGDVFWPQHPRCWDPISKHISNPDFACSHFEKKRGAMLEFEIDHWTHRRM